MNIDFDYQAFRKSLRKEFKKAVKAILNLQEYDGDLIRDFLALYIPYHVVFYNLAVMKKGSSLRIQTNRLLKEALSKISNFNLAMGPKHIIKIMKKGKVDPETVNKLKLVLYIKLFQGVFGHVDKNYNLAFQSFRWCLQYIAYSKRTRLFASIADVQIRNFYELCGLFVPLLCCHCFLVDLKENETLVGDNLKNFIKRQNPNYSHGLDLNEEKKSLQWHWSLDEIDVIDALYYAAFDAMDKFTLKFSKVNENFVLSQFFEYCAEIEEMLAILRSEIWECECDVFGPRIGLLVDIDHMNETIQKNILSITFKLKNDPQIISCLNKVLEGLLLSSGVKFKVIQFFYVLKLYYMQNDEYSFETSSEMDKLTIECLSIIENLIDACDNPDEVTDFQLPKVLLTAMQGKLLVAEKISEDNDGSESPDNYHPRTYQFKHPRIIIDKMKSKLKQKLRLDSSKDPETDDYWIEYWKYCYQDNIGNLPNILSRVYETFIDPSD
ncbi:Ady4p [Saccharomyces paradoxus]|uniref:Ady4p n=1 Tax=Saccharomyces paradoxus TaxID=27291 RepID=A0A8B8UW37_SACPA|nr:Ady4 [Saccharomyces paradoxus]QHS74950.1 Ady4 [Saccharomyces paradoxus]